jgi:hypothetical protein
MALFIKSLPNTQARGYAAAAVNRAYGDSAYTLEEARAALVCDEGNGGPDMENRRGMLFALAFGNCEGNGGIMGTGALSRNETVNVFYYRIDRFTELATMLRRREKEPGLRSKYGDRLSMLQAIEKLLFRIPLWDRIGAFMLVADIAAKMGETLCTKEVCRRMEAVLGTMANDDEADKMGMLRRMHKTLMGMGVRPSGVDMRSGVPRAERDEAERWIRARPEGGVRKAAEAAWKRKPASKLEFMKMLEDERADVENRRLHVLEEAVGEDAVGAWVIYRVSEVPEMAALAWNIGYFCIYPIKSVVDLAEGMENEAEVRLRALDTILWVARRMPPGRRMEAPGLVASAVQRLSEPDEQMGRRKFTPEEILGYWLEGLRSYMNPNPEIACNQLLSVPTDLLRVVGYKLPPNK